MNEKDEMLKEFNEESKRARKNFYRKPTRKYKMYFETLAGEEKDKYMGERNLITYQLEQEYTWQDLVNAKTQEDRQKIYLAFREKYGADRSIANSLGIDPSTVSKMRQRIGVEKFGAPQKAAPALPRTDTSEKLVISNNQLPNINTGLAIEYKINNQTTQNIVNTLIYFSKILEEGQRYDLKFKITAASNGEKDEGARDT